MPRRVSFLLLVIAVLFGAGLARAEEKRRIVVAELDGTSGPTVRNTLLKVLLQQPDIFVVRLSHAEKVAGKSLTEGARKLATQARVSAIIEGSVESGEAGWTASSAFAPPATRRSSRLKFFAERPAPS